MAASVTSERPGKRDRLITGARETIHRQGFAATTIADIAEASDVPVGNVYYYFKSKDELVAAAIDGLLEVTISEARSYQAETSWKNRLAASATWNSTGAAPSCCSRS